MATVLTTVCVRSSSAGEVIELSAKETLTALEMNHGDELQFMLKSGRTVSLVLEDTDAAIVERVTPGGIVYRFSCRVRVDGQPVVLQRFACSQECFYEPYVIDGLRIWPDIVKKVFDLIPVRYPAKGNLRCVTRKAARFALQDATLRICPREMHPWLEEEENFIDVARCYNGDDCYLGPYLGQACHVGMDINHAKGSPLFAPIDFDTQAYFNSVEMGHNNNRWRGIRRWPSGDVWALQTHHLIKLTVPPRTPLRSGTLYATTAGVHVGSHQHTHFEFKVGRKNPEMPLLASDGFTSIAYPIDFDDQTEAAQKAPEVLHLDPWILFWQGFEDRKSHREIHAAMRPLAPAKTGEAVFFAAEILWAGRNADRPACYWTFGDGGFAVGQSAKHVFARAGAYPVTLTVDDGTQRATRTHHVVVNGEAVAKPVLTLAAPHEPSFRPRSTYVADVYGRDVSLSPHTLFFLARNSRPVPASKTVRLSNIGGGERLALTSVQVEGDDEAGWLRITPDEISGHTVLQVGIDATDRKPGGYAAVVAVTCRGAVNSPQRFRVEMEVRGEMPGDRVIIDDRDSGFYATPFFWVGHRFCRCPESRRGHNGFYLTNGSRPAPGEFVRFTPDLKAGEYTVALSAATPFRPGTEFDVRVRHRSSETMVRLRPENSRRIGTFRFDEGADGFVELHAGGSKGLIIADAAVFEATK